jgi:Na+/H+ antiporter NhaD/arsenite permease-like protein
VSLFGSAVWRFGDIRPEFDTRFSEDDPARGGIFPGARGLRLSDPRIPTVDRLSWLRLTVGIVILTCWMPLSATADDPVAKPTSISLHRPAAEPGPARAISSAADQHAEPQPTPQAHPAEAAPHDEPHGHAETGSVGHQDDGHHDDHGPKLGTLLPMWSMTPFALLLLCVAVFPLANPHWWEHNSSKALVASLLAIPTALYLFSYGSAGTHALWHAFEEYVSFVLLLGSLFVISGGVYVRCRLACTPLVNTAFLTIGTAIASFVGTTGASMLLIRPLLRANETRNRVAHIVVFFIFTVSNTGGLLTPLGDPPLFLGFLKGVPFEWTFRLTPQWLVVNSILLSLFFVWDTIVYRREKAQGESETPLTTDAPQETFRLEGLHNFLFLGAIIAIIYCKGNGIGFGGRDWPPFLQELLMLVTGVASYLLTSADLRLKNRFSFGPINEVAVLFAGIFVTMIPALAILNVQGKNLGIESEWQFFWATGVLSSFLDNAPTYLTFAATAAGIQGVPADGRYLAEFLKLPADSGAAGILAAISCGAVFMGANTYIGNGPNFMVKAIAEENNVRMPGFFGYMLYSSAVLLPIFGLVTVLFFA